MRRVVFNLYGINAIDSDGDGIPDDIEMPKFSTGTAPGPNNPWPGDTSSSGNQDMIPNYGETWTRLNPMNADTTYDGVWDGDEDWDGDGFSNLCEVRQGFLEFGDGSAARGRQFHVREHGDVEPQGVAVEERHACFDDAILFELLNSAPAGRRRQS